jgi:hypothetical protein
MALSWLPPSSQRRFTWHGLITFYCSLSVFFVWTAVVSYFVIKAVKEQPEIVDASLG